MLITSASVWKDLQRYVPSIRELSIFEFPTEAHALEEWARHLNDLRWWNHPFSRPWPAHIEYERAFHEAPDRNEFLSALRRLLDVVEPVLLIPDEDNPLFREDNQVLSEVKREEMRRYGLRRARVIAKRMGRWLQLRQKPADEQFLEALERMLLVPDWDEQWKPTGKLTVAHCHAEHDAELHFDFLLTRLREQIPQNPTTLNTFQHRLERFIGISAANLDEISSNAGLSAHGFKGLYKALIGHFPQFTFIDGVTDIMHERADQLADDFWLRLASTLSWRKPWAQRALDLIKVVSAKPANSADKSKLSLKQIALLFIYRENIIGRGKEANKVADQYGYKSGEKLTKELTTIVKVKTGLVPLRAKSNQ